MKRLRHPWRAAPAPVVMAPLVMVMLAAGATTACLVSHLENLGVADATARRELSAFSVVVAKNDGLFLARGDGGGATRLLASGDVGPGGAIFMPALDAGARRILFLSVVDLDVRESTGRDLSLNILTLAEPAAPGAVVASWRKVRLEKIVPPGGTGRQEIFAVAAAAWSRDGRIALALNRPEAAGGDAVTLFDEEGVPRAAYALTGRDIARVSGLSWTGDGGSLVVGLDGAGDTAGQVCRLDLPGAAGRVTPVLVDLGPGRYPALSPDGLRIAAVDESAGQDDIVLMGMDGKDAGRFQRPAGRALTRPFWAPGGRYLYYYSLASTGPLGLVEITILRCLDTRTGQVFDLLRLG